MCTVAKAMAGDFLEWVIFKSGKIALLLNSVIQLLINNPFEYLISDAATRENELSILSLHNPKKPKDIQLQCYAILTGYLTSVRFADMI